MNNEKIILSLELEDGTQEKCEILTFFEAKNGRTYAALQPLNDDETPKADVAVALVRAVPCKSESGEDDYMIKTIRSDMELETAIEAFTGLDFVIDDAESSSAGSDETAETDTDLPTISLPTVDGGNEDFTMLDAFEIVDRKYVALMPINNDGEEITVQLYRAEFTEQSGVEGMNLITITSDAEFQEAQKVFENRLNTEDK